MTRGFIILILLLYILKSDAVKNRNPKVNINKCCPFGTYVNRKKCDNSIRVYATSSKTKIYDEQVNPTQKTVNDTFNLIPAKFLDDNMFLEMAVNMEKFTAFTYSNVYLIETGILKVEMPNVYDRWTDIAVGNFCVDYYIVKDQSIAKLNFWAVMSNAEEFAESNDYLTGAILVSCFFMLLVLIVYFLLPELQNLCGMILMAYVASLFMAFLLLAIIQITFHTEEACVGLTMGIYFFFLASFCWMNVMSYDIWWTFRGYAKARLIHRRGENFKFSMYCLYAWGLPLAMTIGLYVINSMNLRHIPWFIVPNVPMRGCFLEGGVKLLYLYMPMLILIICNWMFYLMTAFNIWRLSRGTAVLDTAAAGNPQAHRTHRHRLMIYLKLSIVMGLNWLLEIVSFLYPGFRMWYISDAYNILLGFAIFLIFVCKKKIFRMLCKRYGLKNNMRWYPSSKSYTSSISDSNQESTTLQSKVSTNPNGMNGYRMNSFSNNNRAD